MSLLRRYLPILTRGAESGPGDSTTKKEEKFDLKKQMEQRGIPILDIDLEYGQVCPGDRV